jgi:hypothetical protein
MEEEQKVPVKIDLALRRKRTIIGLSVSCALVVITIALAVGLKLGLRAAIYSADNSIGGNSPSPSGSSVSKPPCPSSMNFTLYNGSHCQGSALGVFSLGECMKVELIDFSIKRSDDGSSWLSYDQASDGSCGQSANAAGEGGDAWQNWCMEYTSINNSTNSIQFFCQ